MTMRIMFRGFLGVLLVLATAGTSAQGYPEKPIRLIVPYGAASSTDQLARILGESITQQTKQPAVVETKPGAEGFIGVQAAAAAPADGYTILISTSSTHVLNPHLYEKLPYDPVKDFIAVRTLGQSALGLSVNANASYRTVGDLIDDARRNPGKLTFGSATATTRLAGELVQQLANVELLNVPYRANAATVTGLIGGEINMMLSDPALTIPHVKSGRVRILGVTGLQRMAALPDVPTLKEAGLADYYLTFWYAAWVPAKTPAPIVARIDELLGVAMKSPAAQAFLSNGGADNFDLSGDAFAKFQESELLKFGRIVKGANIAPK